MKKKYVGILALLLAIVAISVPFGMWRALADAESPYQIKILEVVDNGAFALHDALAGTDNVKVDTMRMKKFVALRGELTGKYDAVYFGEGVYSTQQPRTFTSSSATAQSEAHNTTAIMNDITRLKVREIEDAYISKGLPVIFHASIAKQSPTGNLYALYTKYANSANRPSNTIFVENTTALTDTVVQNIKNGNALYKQRPHVEIVTKPLDFLEGSKKVYTTGDTLDFTFNANNVKDFSTPVNAKLYASVDKVLPLSDENVVASVTLTARNGKLTYKLPQTFSGPIYWKLELSANGLSDYAEGAFRVHDKQTVIRVLQVLPKTNYSSLLKEQNMTPSYLKTDDYDIQIQTILFNEFNTKSNPNSYANLNGKYDMVIFGFVDSYNTQTAGNLSDEAAAGINEFIKTGQAVMFTHDTMFGDSSNSWVKHFQKTTGQTGLRTNFGLTAVNKSTRTQIVNNGILSQFPFDLSLKPGNTNGYVGQIAVTHNQYYMLDLEDPQIVPWYNILSEPTDKSTYKRDSDDSYDHYYTYSKGNVTYSGTGHTSTGFPEWEQKLFVNTMFRAFIGSNHAPTVTVIAPTAAETTKPSYLKDLVFSYQVEDLDLQDPTVYSSVRFKVDGQYKDNMTIAEKNVPKGSVITEKFKNPLLLKEGKVQIEITARDKQGATVVKTIDLILEKVSANLLTERTLDTVPTNYEFLTGSKIGMTYTVTPQSIPAADIRQGENGLKILEISNVVYTEKLQAGLEVSGSLPEGMTKTGTIREGYTLTKNFDKIIYTMNANGTSYEPDKNSDISFHLNVVPMLKGSYNLNRARLSYEDVHAQSPYSTSIQQLQKYSLIVLGNSAVTLPDGALENGVAIKGSVSSGATIGKKFISSGSNDPVFLTDGNLTITKSNIVNGAIMAKGDVVVPGFAFGEFTQALVGGSVEFGYSSGDATKLSYGGAYKGPDYVNPKPIQKDADALKNEISRAFSFTDANTQLTELSAAYAAMPSNGSKQPTSGTDSGGVITLTGTNPGLNVFNMSSADTVNMNDLKISMPAGASAVVNISGGALRLSNVLSSDPSRTLINYTGTDTMYIGNAPTNLFPNGGNGSEVQSSVLAPRGVISYANASLSGSIVAKELQAVGSVSLYNTPFVGNEPPAPPIVGEPRVLEFTDVFFNAIVKTKSISMEDKFIWAGDTATLNPIVRLSDDTVVTDPLPLLTWSSNNPAVQIVYPTGTKDGKAASITVSGSQAGEAIITATATDGSGITGTATVTIEAPTIAIEGDRSVNVGQTLQNIQAVVNSSNLRIDTVAWELLDNGQNYVDLTPQEDPASLFVTGKKSGEVTIRATVRVTNIRNNTFKDLVAEHRLSVTDNLDSIVINGPESVKKGGTIDLSTVILPEAANIESITWAVTDGPGNATLTPGSQTPSKTATLQGVAPGPVTISVTVRTAGDNPIERTVTKTIWVLDFTMTGPNTTYVGDSIDLNASLLPANYPGVKGTVAWSVTNVANSGPGANDYAKLGTATNNGNTIALTGSSPGTVKVTAVITTPAGDFTVTHPVTIKPIVTALLLPPTVRVEKGVPFDLINNAPLMVHPISIPVQDIQSQLTWTSAGEGVSVDQNGVVTGLKEGSEVIVTVSYKRTPDSTALTASTRVIVAKAADPNAPTDGDRY